MEYIVILKLKYNKKNTKKLIDKFKNILKEPFEAQEKYQVEFNEEDNYCSLYYMLKNEDIFKNEYAFISFFIDEEVIKVQFNGTSKTVETLLKEVLSLGLPLELEILKGIVTNKEGNYNKSPELKELLNSIDCKCKDGYDAYIEDSELSKINKIKEIINTKYANNIKNILNVDEFTNIEIEWDKNFGHIYLICDSRPGMYVGLDFGSKKVMNIQCGYVGNECLDMFKVSLDNHFNDIEDTLNKVIGLI